jgi:hypothetical protein
MFGANMSFMCSSSGGNTTFDTVADMPITPVCNVTTNPSPSINPEVNETLIPVVISKCNVVPSTIYEGMYVFPSLVENVPQLKSKCDGDLLLNNYSCRKLNKKLFKSANRAKFPKKNKNYRPNPSWSINYHIAQLMASEHHALVTDTRQQFINTRIKYENTNCDEEMLTYQQYVERTQAKAEAQALVQAQVDRDIKSPVQNENKSTWFSWLGF